jgi:hypothetical protein
MSKDLEKIKAKAAARRKTDNLKDMLTTKMFPFLENQYNGLDEAFRHVQVMFKIINDSYTDKLKMVNETTVDRSLYQDRISASMAITDFLKEASK